MIPLTQSEKLLSSIQQLLNEIRDCESSLEMKIRPHGLTGDGSLSSQQAQVKGSPGKHVHFQGMNDMDPVKWFIPRIPSSWKEALGPGLFQTLLEWHSAALSGKSQAHLDSDFKMVVEDFTPSKPGQGKCQAKICHAKSEPSPNGSKPANADGNVDAEDVKPKKGIQLATKSCHVVTECFS